MERNQAIDIAKGIGIILVTWGHTACPIKNDIYIFHIPLFFIISGFLFNDKKSFKETVKRKIKSLIIPYFFFFFFTKLFFFLLCTYTGNLNRILEKPILFIHPYGVASPLWFLLSLFETTLIYSLICKISTKEPIRFILSFILAIIGYILCQKNIILPMHLVSSISMVFLFHVGSIAKQYNIFSIKNKFYNIAFISLLIFIYLFGVLNNIKVDIWSYTIDKNFILYLLASISGSFLVIFLSCQIYKSTRFITSALSFIGKESLIIFALHLISFEFARAFLGIPTYETTTNIEGIYTLFYGIVLSLFIGLSLKRTFPAVFR